MKTLKEHARDAINVQDACNLSGVVHSFSRAMTDLREILTKEGSFSTTDLNQHPICILYASKIASLTGCENGLEFKKAYDEACRILEK